MANRKNNLRGFTSITNNKFFPILVALLLCALSAGLWKALENREETLRINTVNAEANKIVEIISIDLHNRIESLQRLVKRWEIRGGTPKNEFISDAQSYIQNDPGYQALSWVDKSYHVRWLVPLKGNESALNLNLAFEERRRIALEKAKIKKLPTLTAPINLVQGGKGFLVYFPIYVNEEFKGFLSTVFRTQKWLNHVLYKELTKSETKNYQNLVLMDNQEIYKTKNWDNQKESSLSIEAKTTIFGHNFTIKSFATNSFISESHTLLPELVFLIGVILSLLISVIVYLVQRANIAVKKTLFSKNELENEMIIRRGVENSLQKERRRLSYILEGTNVGTWEWNVQTGETIFNERWANIVGYSLKELEPTSIDTWMNLAHPDDLKASGEQLERHFNGELDYYEIESRMKHKNGAWVWVLDRGKTSTWTEDGKPLLVAGTHKDITKAKENEIKIQHLATHDALTDLPSLRLAKDRLHMAIEISKRKETLTAVMFLDLDGFKIINDTYGHEAGDFLLQEVSKRLLTCVRKTDTVSRIGGDEFLLIISDYETNDVCISIAKKIIGIIAEPFIFKNNQIKIGISIGISNYPNDSRSNEELVVLADKAMYKSKNSGKNRFTFV